MQVKEYLIATFRYNDWANQQAIKLLAQLPAPAEAIRLFSHLITSQCKWMARLTGDPVEANLAWFAAPYAAEELAAHWQESLSAWLPYLEQMPDEELQRRVHYVGGEEQHTQRCAA